MYPKDGRHSETAKGLIIAAVKDFRADGALSAKT
jgi:hypothetical protein